MTWRITGLLTIVSLVGLGAGQVVHARPYCERPNPPPICSDESQPPIPVRGSPEGMLDSVVRRPDGVLVSGTAIDPDAAGPVEVVISIVGSGSAFSVWASETAGAFNAVVPALPGTAVCATAINRNQGSDRPLGCRPLRVTLNPVGVLQLVSAEAGPHLRIRGWAIDPDTRDAIDVHLYVNDIFSQSVRADVCCQGDVDPVYGSAHVFNVNIPTTLRGRYTVCAYGINVGAGDANTPLGCTTVSQRGSPETGRDIELGEELSLESYPQPGKVVRIVGETENLTLQAVDGATEMDVSDARFRKVRGLSDSDCVSFESVKFPNRYIRHDGNKRLLLHAGGPFSGWDFNGDATFCKRDFRHYESANKPGYFLRDDGGFVLAELDHSDPNWGIDTMFIETSPATLDLFFACCGAGTTDGMDTVHEMSSACTGPGPPLTNPPDTTTLQCATIMLSNPQSGATRPVFRCAVGIPGLGFYAWIKTRERQLRAVYKIETGLGVCFF